ncbi:hypothetical protein [Polyangium jinanense]|uniref:Lipoprotein n=1 Tax=Polyangium jinanense TaxID=2829994 RepID=A0A9X4B022_9BACT|nr:hypothetical protein [Polyangium jinanense]MDC3958514.1 hypothetical protein [Polyangium jinanense]MDC3989000.1 hypothetical protein [Polyangium jinanense]
MNMNKMMASLAVGGMIAGLAACGGSQAQPENADSKAGAEAGAQASCSGQKADGAAHSCKAGACSGKKEGEAAPADGAAPAPADAPK